MKSGGWETVRLHSKHNPGNAYWYSFDFRGRYQLLGRGYEFIPPGNKLMVLFFMLPFFQTLKFFQVSGMLMRLCIYGSFRSLITKPKN